MSTADAEQRAAERRPPPATILVVDDNPVNLQVIVRTLDGSGHRILAAKDPRMALEIARRARPELILLDIMMPGQDGFEVCRAIKADDATRDSMVIFLSALGEVSNKVLGLQLGAVDYITKPIQAEEVVARVSSHLWRQYLERELRRSRDQLNHELESAARMQRLLLPERLPSLDGFTAGAHYQTSRHAGGDYYDAFVAGPGQVGLIVADVSGHGAPAAIVMAMLRATLHALPVRNDPSDVLDSLNRQFAYLWESAMFATAIYATFDLAARRLRVACAGHPAPLLFRRQQGVCTLTVEAVPPLLMMDLGKIPCVEHEIAPGDRFVFYTDGITDRLAADGSMFEVERLASALAMAAAGPPQAVVNRLVQDVEAFAAGQEAEDDQTLLVVGID